jgi:membrane-associated protein
MGRRLFKKDTLVFRHEYIMKAEKFYEKYGSKTMLIAHFIPVVRSFAPVVAGVAKMNRLQYVIYDAIGIVAWGCGITLLGYYLGLRIPGIEHYIEPVLLGIIVIFLGPTIYHILKDPRIREAIRAKIGLKASGSDQGDK